jgi:hypothetical protein
MEEEDVRRRKETTCYAGEQTRSHRNDTILPEEHDDRRDD